MKKLSRRGFLRLSAAATTGAVMAACVPVTPAVVEEPAIVEGKPIIRFTTDWYGGIRGEHTNAFLAKWKDEVHPDITIAYEPTPRVQDRVRVDFAAGTPADVMLFAPELFASFYDQLLDLTPFWDDADEAWKKDVLGFDPSYYWEGKLLGVPFQHNIWQPCINVDLFEQAGVPMPWEYDHDGDKWWDWNDFLETARAITALSDDIWGYEVGGNSTYMQWGPWIRSNGGEYVRPPWPEYDNLYVESALAEPEAHEALKFVTDLMCTHKVAIPVDLHQEIAQTLQVSPFFAGKIGIAQTTSEAQIRATQMNAHRVVTPRSPRTKYARQHQGNVPHVAWRGTKFPEACWEFMVFLDGPWCQRQIALKGGAMPGLKSIYDDPEYYADFPPIARETLKVGAEENETLPGLFLNFEEWRDEVEAIAMDMFLCEIPVDQAIGEMDSTANTILSRKV